MEKLTIRELLEAVHGRLVGGWTDLEATVDQVETDSRRITPGSLFIPLKGERFNGHAYVNDALEKGAAGALVQREQTYLPGKFYIMVENTHRALGDLALWYKRRFSVPLVAIVGSVGKTTTKDMVAAVLSQRFRVMKTEGNLNNDIGVPLTLLRLDRSCEVAVVELGINHPGEMEYLSFLAEPDVVVMTNIGDSHIENFGSREVTLASKSRVFDHAKPGCLAVLNGNDPLLRSLDGTGLFSQAVFCGVGEGCDYRAWDLNSDRRSHMTCQVRTPAGTCAMDIPALGDHMIYPALMAAAVGERFGMSLEEITAGVRNFAPTKMRMNILSRAEGITILDDGYNANPQSMRAAIEVLDGYTGDYKIAVLGDMFELGPLAAVFHAGIGQYLGTSGVNCLVAVGELAKNIYDAAIASDVPECFWYATKQEAERTLAKLVRPGCTILVKASRGMAFEEITGFLKSITEEA